MDYYSEENDSSDLLNDSIGQEETMADILGQQATNMARAPFEDLERPIPALDSITEEEMPTLPVGLDTFNNTDTMRQCDHRVISIIRNSLDDKDTKPEIVTQTVDLIYRPFTRNAS